LGSFYILNIKSSNPGDGMIAICFHILLWFFRIGFLDAELFFPDCGFGGRDCGGVLIALWLLFLIGC